MSGILFRRLFFLLCIFIISQDVDAQYKFYVSMSFNYNCHDRYCEEGQRMVNGIVRNVLSGLPISFNTKNECEAARNMVVNSLNEAKSIASSSYGVKFNFTVTPCSGFGGGNFVFLGPNRGSSFYSPSVADEIKNWSEDNERLQAALNPEWERSEQMAVETSDYSFDEKRKNLREGFVIDTDKPFRSLNIDANGRINTFSPNITSPKVIPANEQLVNEFLLRVNKESAPSLIDNKYIDWIKDQFEKVSGCNCDIDAILSTSLRTEEEKAILGIYREFQKQLLDEAISSIDKIILSIRKSKEHKEKDMAILALDCYEKDLLKMGENQSINYLSETTYERVDVNSIIIPNSIRSLAEMIDDYNRENYKTGFHAVLYCDVITNEYTIAFEGSAFELSRDALHDLENNVLQGLGEVGSQFKIAEDLGNYIRDNKININITGHSLGGALASVVGLITGLPTYTYNAEGVSDKILKKFGLLEKKQNKEFQITAYHTANDILTVNQYTVQRLSEITIDTKGDKNNYFAEAIGTEVNIGILNTNPKNIFTAGIEAHKMEPIVKYFINKNNNNLHLLQKYENSKKNMIREIDNIRMRTSEYVYIETE